METISQQTVKDLYRIVLYGPESTGKTSLAQGLAAHFKTQWVPEFARTYLQEKWEREQAVCALADQGTHSFFTFPFFLKIGAGKLWYPLGFEMSC